MRRTIFVLVLALGSLFGGAPARASHLTAPTIAEPADGDDFCARAGADFHVTGSANAGVDVDLLVDGAAAASKATDGDYDFAVSRSPGAYTIEVQQSDGGETVSSPAVDVSVFGLGDVLGSVARSASAISPRNQDGYRDSTTLSVPARRDGTIRFRIYRSGTQVAWSPAIAAGDGDTASWTWKGKGSSTYNGGDFVPSGSYEARAIWTDPADASCTFLRSTTITVDNVAPNLSSADESPNTFYPHEGDDLTEFKDMIRFAWNDLTERTNVRVQLFRDGESSTYRTLSAGWDTGDGSISWNGRRSDGSLAPAGTYDWRFSLTDSVGNRRYSARREFRLSHRHLESRTTTIARDGDAYYDVSRGGCGDAYPGSSDWSQGVWLYVLDCYYDDEIIDGVLVDYSFPMPDAPYYHKLTMKAYGYSIGGDDLFGFFRDFEAGEDEYVGSIAGSSAALRTFGTEYDPTRFFNPDRKVRGSLFLISPCDCTDVDYDVRTVYVKLTYGVLV